MYIYIYMEKIEIGIYSRNKEILLLLNIVRV
jgi:hypothetical protein